ncbi:hypothetical protein L7F22_026068 [Adiantum nelumboides]|nr:hypothetical protein [Adiantum nelumboides]
MHNSVKCISYNVCGLCNHDKWRLTWHYVHTCKADNVVLQIHNQHEFTAHSSYFAGYWIAYAGLYDFSGVLMLIRHELQLVLAHNDPGGPWMVVQCLINGQMYGFGGVYAHTSSRQRAALLSAMSSYQWLSNAFLCGDFNNAPALSNNTTGHSHMLTMEMSNWTGLVACTQMLDLWSLLHPNVVEHTFQHNALSSYRARLDRWYVLNMQQFDEYVCKMSIVYTLLLSHHALW